MFHTGSLRVHPVEGVYPVKDSSILYRQVEPLLVWLSTPDVLLGVFFDGLGWAPLGSGVESKTFLTMRTFMWLPLTKIFEICSAVFTFYSLKAILAFHKYYITSQTPVFHTGSLGVHPVEGVNPVKDSSIVYHSYHPF